MFVLDQPPAPAGDQDNSIVLLGIIINTSNTTEGTPTSTVSPLNNVILRLSLSPKDQLIKLLLSYRLHAIT